MTTSSAARADAPAVPDGDYIVAAVHAESRHLDSILTRAASRSAATGRQAIFVTVLTRHPARGELMRLRLKLRRYPQPVHLVATSVDVDRRDERERLNLISDELVRATDDLGASELIIGFDPYSDPTDGSIAERLTVLLATRVDLRFAVPSGRTAAEAPIDPPPATLPHLTEDGRRRLSRRAARIERDDLPRSRSRLRQANSGASALAAYEAQVNQLRRLGELVVHAPSTSAIPDDPHRVELGEQVTVQLHDTGRRRRLVIVDPVEAVRGRACVSASSGLGRELLGRKVGDDVAIPTSRGPAGARIISATRANEPG